MQKKTSAKGNKMDKKEVVQIGSKWNETAGQSGIFWFTAIFLVRVKPIDLCAIYSKKLFHLDRVGRYFSNIFWLSHLIVDKNNLENQSVDLRRKFQITTLISQGALPFCFFEKSLITDFKNWVFHWNLPVDVLLLNLVSAPA